MQYHLNGFTAGDPDLKPRAPGSESRRTDVDVLIIGCGPAGLTLAAQLSAFPGIVTRIAERKAGPLEMGQADGIACRSVEMFQAFGFAEKVMREAYWVNEVTFWRPGEQDGQIMRADRIQDVEDGLSEFPHVILSQARVHDFYLDLMRKSPRRLEPDYNLSLVDLNRGDDPDHPVTARFERLDRPGAFTEIRARYVVGCDGARSQVRQAIGHRLEGRSARQLWGVMDVLVTTDFPDIRLKCAIQSADQGSVLIIPREGGHMVRLYIELDALQEGERAADRGVSAEALISKAQAILHPYLLDVKEVAWWSAYEIGQRVCDGFDDVAQADRGTRHPRIFIAGDACHTHSPKAGQGMNVSMADTFNLGWKLAAVLRGTAQPDLLDSYSAERQAKAQELIDFDRDMARLFSARPRDPEEAALFQSYFKRHGRYTAGVETRYAPSAIIGTGARQGLAEGFVVGTRFHSAPVVRLADARPMHLGHVLRADGRWRLIAFAGDEDRGATDGAIAALCRFLTDDPGSPLSHPSAGDEFEVNAVFQHPHRSLQITQMPELLRPARGCYGLTDYERVFCADHGPAGDIFDLRAISRDRGAVLLIRPDQFVAEIFAPGDHQALSRFCAGFLPDPDVGSTSA